LYEEKSEGGELFFDGYEPRYMKYEEFNYLPVVEPWFWAVPLNAAWFGPVNFTVTNVTNLTADPYFNGSLSPNRVILDTGTSGMVFPTENE
jgi:hypothetical protein